MYVYIIYNISCITYIYIYTHVYIYIYIYIYKWLPLIEAPILMFIHVDSCLFMCYARFTSLAYAAYHTLRICCTLCS